MHTSTVKIACRHILTGDLSAARAELGDTSSLTPTHARMIAGSLREAAKRYNAPSLATRSPFNL